MSEGIQAGQAVKHSEILWISYNPSNMDSMEVVWKFFSYMTLGHILKIDFKIDAT